MADREPSNNQKPESDESNSLTAQELRDQVSQSINELRTGIFGALKAQNVDSALWYLLVTSTAPLVRAYSESPAKITDLIQHVWPNEYAIFTRYLEDGRIKPTQLSTSIETLIQRDESSARIFEQLLIFTEIVSQMEEGFSQQEWVLQELRQELQGWQRQGKFQQLQISLRSEQYTASTTSRGALQLEVSASKPTIVAGEEFSVFVVIHNPFEVPITLYSVETQIPVELVDVVGRQRRGADVRAELEEERQSRQNRSKSSRFGPLLEFFETFTPTRLIGELIDLIVYQWSLALKIAATPESRIAQAVAPSEIEDRSRKLDVRSQIEVGRIEGGTVIGTQYQPVEIAIASASPRYIDNLLWRLESFRRGLTPITLQPGDSMVKQFIFETTRWLLFTPLAHTMRIQVRYSVDDRDHLDTVPFALNIQANITATMVGAVIGGFIGGMARLLSDAQKVGSINPVAQFLSLSLSVILSAVTVVSFARKSGVQQIVSIEDFWGGLFLGFLIGFLGQNYALNLIAPNSANPVLPTPSPTPTP